jgi:hypothetical protein
MAGGIFGLHRHSGLTDETGLKFWHNNSSILLLIFCQ